MEALTLTEAEIGAFVGQYIWPMFRIASFFMVIPVIGTRLVSMRIRMGLTVLVTIVVAPLIGPVPEVEALSFDAVMVTLQQILIGTLMGLMFVMLMQLFVVAGQMISMQMGLGFASLIDPANGVSVPILSQIFLVAVTLMFLAMNGHLVMIEVIVESFTAWPISTTILGEGSMTTDTMMSMLMRISWLFASALLLSLPAVSAVLIVNMAFGIMTRASPQMNVFSLGFPIAMMFGLFIVWVSSSSLLPKFQKLSGETFVFMRSILGV